MEVVNPFILKNKERMIVFLDQLSIITDPTNPPGHISDSSSTYNPAQSDTGIFQLQSITFWHTSYKFRFLGRELATLHHICVSYQQELQTMAKTNNSLKKLVTVCDMLSKHKLKYREMIS